MKYFIPAFFLLLGLGELTRIQLPSAVAFNLIDISVIFLAIYWFKNKKKDYLLKKPILAFLLIGIFSLLINLFNYKTNEILIGSLYLARWISYTAVYFVIRDLGKDDKEKVIKYMTLGGALFVVIGLLQYVFYPALRNLYYLGWDEHLNRLFSSFLDPNFAGSFIVLFIIFVFILRNKINLDKKLIWGILGLSLLALVLTYSRGAFLMLIASAGMYSLINRNVKLLGVLVILFVGLFIILSPNFKNEGTNLLRTASIYQRFVSTQEGIKIFSQNPLGVGFNTLRYAREEQGFSDKSKFGPSHSGAGVENSFVFVLVTTGILGFLSYMYLLGNIFKLGFKNMENKFGLVLVISLSGLAINALFINSLFYSFLMVWIWAVAGLTENS